MTADESRPQVEIDSDEDWKGRVKAEDAALDQQFREQGRPASSTASEEASGTNHAPPQAAAEFPEATFEGLVTMLSTQAMLGMGVIPGPGGKKPEKNLAMARYFIDLLGVLEEKTSGQLSSEELAALSDSLHSLRMAYVQFSKEAV